VWPLWGGLSVGLVAAIAVLVVGIGAGATGYWRSRNLPGQEWRHRLKPWKFSVDVGTVSAVHAIIGFILTLVVFVALQRSCEGLVVDSWTSTGAVAVASGLAGYWIYLSVSSITTPKLAMLLIVFMRQGVLERASAPRVVSIVFIVMGVLLAGVGLVPVNVSTPIHNFCAVGMSISFLTLLIGSPWILRGMPKRFFVFCTGGIVLLLASAVLFEPIGYYNLTAFELAAFSIIFGWISVFIRFISADGDPDDRRSRGRSRQRRGPSRLIRLRVRGARCGSTRPIRRAPRVRWRPSSRGSRRSSSARRCRRGAGPSRRRGRVRRAPGARTRA
jgi:hypothetical protein